MKKIITAWVLVLSVTSVFAQSLDEIISKYYEAIGGKEKVMEIKTVVSEGNFTYQGMDIPVTIYQEHNKGLRVEISVMGMTGYILNTMTEGWTYLPFQGMAAAEAMTADQVQEALDQLDLQGPLMDYAKKGHLVEYLGKDDFEGTECYKIKAVLKGGSEVTMFIDPSTNLLIKQLVKTKSGGQENTQEQTFSNYQKLEGGLLFAFDQTGFGPGEISFSKIEVNVPIDASKFQKSN